MNKKDSQIMISDIDTERFGITIARALVSAYDNLHEAVRFCEESGVSMLIARCPVDETQIAQDMEEEGFRIMDTLVYYSRNLKRMPPPDVIENVTIRLIRDGEEQQVQDVAGRSFRGYYGHYHADRRLDKKKCDEGYVSWATRSSCERDDNHDVLVAVSEDRIVGFATMRLNTGIEGEGVLFGVDNNYQGKGIYKSFIIKSMQWCKKAGADCMVVSTQINNMAVQKVWSRVGFEPTRAYYTFHKWFEG
jgi:GNAT superfamily N-acetyltransferase